MKITKFEINHVSVETDAFDTRSEVHLGMTMDPKAANELFDLIQNANLAFTDRSEDITCCDCCKSDPNDREAEDDDDDREFSCEDCKFLAENRVLLEDNYEMADILNSLCIKQVFYSDKKGEEVVVVLFEDGKKVITRPHDGDAFDLKVGVALAIAEKMFGTKTQFGKFVKKTAKTTSVKPISKKAAKTKAARSKKLKGTKNIE